MNVTVANALSGYFETLYKMNQRLVKLCGIDIMNDNNTGEDIILDLIQDIPRVIPYSVKKGSGKLEYKKKTDC